jgi:hypothetical protein
MISIYITGNINNTDLTITIDDSPVDFTVINKIISVTSHIETGLHKLKIVSCSDKRWSIDQVLVHGASLRKLLYLSWITTTSNQRIQPCTELWEHGQCWTLPFGHPLSHWINITETKIPNNYYGKDLLEKFCIWYPDRVALPDQFPQVVRDFFNYNFDFTVVDKSKFDVKHIPYTKYQGHISADLLELATTEILNNTDIVLEHGKDYKQRSDNQKEFNLDDDQSWKILWLKQQTQDRSRQEQYPATWQLIDSLNMDFWHAFVGIIPPGGFIYPHTDNPTGKDLIHLPYVGCTQLYIPIQWPENCYIKFAKAGIVKMDSGPMLINTDYFTHALANNSNQYRYVLAIGLNKNDIAQYSGH